MKNYIYTMDDLQSIALNYGIRNVQKVLSSHKLKGVFNLERHRTGGKPKGFLYTEAVVDYIKKIGNKELKNTDKQANEANTQYPVYINITEETLKGLDTNFVVEQVLPILVKKHLKLTRKALLAAINDVR